MNAVAPDPALELIKRAYIGLSRGAYAEVRVGLRAALGNGILGEGPSLPTFLALRLIGEAARKQHDIEAAVAAYTEGATVARALHRADLESAAVEGLALVARFDGEPVRALALLRKALALAREAGDTIGVAAVLSNQGNLLADTERFEQAEAVLREALDLGVELPLQRRAPIEDNLGMALAGLDRPEEAVEMAASAAAHFEQIGAGFDQYEALQHLESHQHRAGLHEEAVATFAQARELISSLEAENLNVEYYLTFADRRREIEQQTVAHLSAPDRSEADVALEIGARAQRAIELGRQADLDIEAGNFAEAEAALLRALEHWSQLRALHELSSVHHALSSVYIETGQMAKARERARVARRLAHELGDPYQEMLACSNLARMAMAMTGDLGTVDALQLVVRARALRPLCFLGDDGKPAYEPGAEPPLDGGVIDSQDAAICFDHAAFDLAEEAARRSVAAIEEVLDRAPETAAVMRYRLWHRLRRLYVILRRRDGERDRAEADELARRLEDFLGESPDLRSRMMLQTTLGSEMFSHDVWTEETLERLVAACEAYEEMRERALPLGGLAEFAEARNAPFPEAIEVALHLGRTGYALELLERSKSRSLLDSLGAAAEVDGGVRAVRPASVAELSAALATRDAKPVLVELFAGPRRVHAFVLDGSGQLEVTELADRQAPEWRELERLVHRNSLAGRGSALAALKHPALRRVSGFVAGLADGRPIYLAPHEILHALPLHLHEQDGVLAPLPRVYHLPSGSLLPLAAPRTAAEGTVVGGDPGGDLGFAGIEAEAVGEHLGAGAALGSACSYEWLAAELRPGAGPRRLIHLACHALFQPTRGERSGLELVRDGEPALVAVDQLAELDWSSELVVLSACSSGQQEVGAGDELAGIARALLGRGARALIVSLWEVPDLATYLLVESLYSLLSDRGEMDLREVSEALEGAQRAVRDMSARDLIAVALRLHRGGGDAERRRRCALAAAKAAHAAAGNHEEARRCIESLQALEQDRDPAPDIGGIDWARQESLAEAAAYEVKPFLDPVYWAAFVLTGRR